MRKLLLLLVLAWAGSALAQDNWVGGSFGSPAVSFHFGVENALGPNADLRGNLGFSYVYTSGFYVGADALFDLGVDTTAPFQVYAGGGPFLALGRFSGFGIEGVLGGEYRLVDAGFPEGGVFLELGPAFYIAPFAGLGVTGRLGFNYHF
jgi:hypothetical protein